MAYKGIRVRYILAGASVASAAAGAGVSYVLTERALRKKYHDKAEAEIAEMREHYKQVFMEDEYSSPILMAEKYKDSEVDIVVEEDGTLMTKTVIESTPGIDNEVLDRLQAHASRAMTNYGDFSKISEDEDIVPEGEPAGDQDQVSNIFMNPPNWDQEVEESKRAVNPLAPYVISQEEFFQNEPGFEQMRLTYFTDDDVLSDEKDQPIESLDAIGEENLQRFGHGSRDDNIVHVRNENMEADFEIVRTEGSFAEMVYGFKPTSNELKHSRQRVGKFREDRAE